MNLGLAIFLIILALVGGAVGGFFIARRYMMDYFKKIHQLTKTCCVC